MTSLLSSRSKAERGKQQIAVIREYSNAERKPVDHISRKTNDIYTLKLSKARKNKREVKSRHLESTNYDVMINDDALNSDVINLDVNKPIARKRYAQKHLFMSEKGFVKSSLRVCSRTVTKITLILAIIISILGGLCNIKLPERKSPIGNSSSLFPSELHVDFRFLDSSVFSILRSSSATIIGINEGLCSCINKGMVLSNNKQLMRRMEVLHNTIMHEERGYLYPGYATYALAKFAAGNVCAGKHLDIYIFRSVEFCTFHDDYLDIYIVNLDSGDKFPVFCNLIYLYIYILFTVHGHPAAGQHTLRLFSLIYILWFIFPQK